MAATRLPIAPHWASDDGAAKSADGANHFFNQHDVAGHEVDLEQGGMLLGDECAHGIG